MHCVAAESAVVPRTVQAVSPKERTIAKQVVLGTMYGMGVAEGAKRMGVSRAEAQSAKRKFLGQVWITAPLPRPQRCPTDVTAAP